MKALRKPEEVTVIYDNGGESFDRYTVVLKTNNLHFAPFNLDCLALSENPDSPSGFSQYSTCVDGAHLGKVIKWADMPLNLQKHIIKRA